MLVAGPFLGRAIGKYGPKPVVILGFALILVGPFGLAAFHSTTYEVGALAVPMMIGNVAVLISMSNVIVLSVDPKTMGIQTGMNQTFRNLGSALGPVLTTSILASYAFTEQIGGFPFQNYHTLGYQVVFGLVAVVAAVGLLLSLALRNFRYLADGSRSGHPSGAPVEEKPGDGAGRVVAAGRNEQALGRVAGLGADSLMSPSLSDHTMNPAPRDG
jgi:MFS family permease